MAPRPQFWLGQYLQSVTQGSIVCKRYTLPPFEGDYVDTLKPGTIAGPISKIQHSDRFMTVKIGDFWINVWGTRALPDPVARERRGTVYAWPVAAPSRPSDSDLWRSNGDPIPYDPSIHDGPDAWSSPAPQGEHQSQVSGGADSPAARD